MAASAMPRLRRLLPGDLGDHRFDGECLDPDELVGLSEPDGDGVQVGLAEVGDPVVGPGDPGLDLAPRAGGFTPSPRGRVERPALAHGLALQHSQPCLGGFEVARRPDPLDLAAIRGGYDDLVAYADVDTDDRLTGLDM